MRLPRTVARRSRSANARQRDSLFGHPQLQVLQKALQQGRSERKPEAYFEYVEGLSDARTQLREFFKLLLSAEVVKWQTRTFEGRVAQAVRVQVPPSAPNSAGSFPFSVNPVPGTSWRVSAPSRSGSFVNPHCIM